MKLVVGTLLSRDGVMQAPGAPDEDTGEFMSSCARLVGSHRFVPD